MAALAPLSPSTVLVGVTNQLREAPARRLRRDLSAFFTAVFFATAGASFFAAARFAAHLFFTASETAFLPAADSFRLGFEGSGVAFDGCLGPFAGGFFAAPEVARKVTAFFARVIAAFASRSSSWISSALTEDRSVNFDINASILAIRLRVLLDFMTTPVHVHSPDLRRRFAHGRDEFDFHFQPTPARLTNYQVPFQESHSRVGKGLHGI
jgi:hypothetical protein